jgi:hypothetical protein
MKNPDNVQSYSSCMFVGVEEIIGMNTEGNSRMVMVSEREDVENVVVALPFLP